MLLKNQQRKMSIDKARNIVSKIDLNYADEYKSMISFGILTGGSDRITHHWNTGEMLSLEIRDYEDQYTTDQIIAMKKLSNWHSVRGNDLAIRLEGNDYGVGIEYPEVE